MERWPKIWAKIAHLGQFIYSVTLTLTLNLKFLFKAYCHDILTNAILYSIFLNCQFLQFIPKIIMCKNPPIYANFLTF